PEEVYDRPTTTFVAGFIGVSNLMPGTVRKSGEKGEVELDSGVQVSTDVDGFRPGERCHAVVRPEKLTIGSGDGGRPSVEGLAELRRPWAGRNRRPIPTAVRREDDLQGRRQRQQHLLQQAEAGTRPGQLGWPQPLRRHRLDGEADVRPRLPAADQPRRSADGV